MSRTRRTIGAAVTGALFLVVGAGAGGAATRTASPATKHVVVKNTTTINLGIIPIHPLLPVYAANKLGYFQRNGLTVNTTVGDSGAALISAVLGGSLDMTFSNHVSTMQAISEGFPLKVVANANSEPTSGKDAQPVIVKADSGIQGPKDLIGKTIAVNGLSNINHLAVSFWLRKHGVPPAKVKFVELPFSANSDALLRGSVDAALHIEPVVTILGDKVRRLAYPYYEMQPGFNIGGFVTTSKFISENPLTVTRFARAIRQVDAYLAANPEQRLQLQVEFTKGNVAINRNVDWDVLSPYVSTKGLQSLANTAYGFGMLSRKVNVTKELVYKSAIKPLPPVCKKGQKSTKQHPCRKKK